MKTGALQRADDRITGGGSPCSTMRPQSRSKVKGIERPSSRHSVNVPAFTSTKASGVVLMSMLASTIVCGAPGEAALLGV